MSGPVSGAWARAGSASAHASTGTIESDRIDEGWRWLYDVIRQPPGTNSSTCRLRGRRLRPAQPEEDPRASQLVAYDSGQKHRAVRCEEESKH